MGPARIRDRTKDSIKKLMSVWSLCMHGMCLRFLDTLILIRWWCLRPAANPFIDIIMVLETGRPSRVLLMGGRAGAGPVLALAEPLPTLIQFSGCNCCCCCRIHSQLIVTNPLPALSLSPQATHQLCDLRLISFWFPFQFLVKIPLRI